MKQPIALGLTCGFVAALCCQAEPLDFWTWRNPYPTGNSLNRVIHLNGQFMGVGQLGTIVTSPDGANWIQRSSGTSEDLNDIAYANGLYVAVGGTSGGSAQSFPSNVVNVFYAVCW